MLHLEVKAMQSPTRKQVEEICSMNGVSLDESWDGKSEEIPVIIPSNINPWTSQNATVKYSKVKEFFVNNWLWSDKG